MAVLTKQILEDAVKEGIVDGYEKVPYDEAVCSYRNPRKIFIGGGLYAPHVAAHEVGHGIDTLGLENSPLRKAWIGVTGGMNRFGPKLSLLAGTVAALAGANTKALAAIGTAGALSTVPYMMRELAASKNGYDILRRHGYSKKEALAAGGGLYSHAIPALYGFIPLGGKLFVDYIKSKMK